MAVPFLLQSSPQDQAEARRLLKPHTHHILPLPSLLSLIPFLVSPESTASVHDIYMNLCCLRLYFQETRSKVSWVKQGAGVCVVFTSF